jgi:hypothetical protein
MEIVPPVAITAVGSSRAVGELLLVCVDMVDAVFTSLNER